MKYLFLVSYFTLCCYALFWVEIKPAYNEPTSNQRENSCRKKGKKAVMQLSPFVIEWNMLMRRSGQVLIARYFVPESVLGQGVFFSNLCKSLLNENPFPIDSAIRFFDFCFDECPQLSAVGDSYLCRYKSNISIRDSTLRIVCDMVYLSNIENSKPEFSFGALIDIIASVDTVSISDKTIEQLLDLRLNLFEFKKMCDARENNMEGCDFINSLFEITNEINIEVDKLEPTTKDSRVTGLKAWSRLIVTYENKKIVKKFVAEAKRIRLEIVGF